MPNGMRTENSLDISKLAGSKLTRCRVCLFSFQYTPLTRLMGLAVEMYRMKRLLNFLETRTFLIQQKITKVGLYTNNTEGYSFKVLDNNHS